MLIRPALPSDSSAILSWRNDAHSRSMFANGAFVESSEHDRWYKRALSGVDTFIFIAEQGEEQLGVCRFDISESDKSAEVSINLNPLHRGKGLSRDILERSILQFLSEHPIQLTAKVKKSNNASLRIFHQSGFLNDCTDRSYVNLKLPINSLKFEPVNENHSFILYYLLKQREYKISHATLPTFEDHESFVLNHPYRYWYLVSREKPIGTLYIQNDNSVGLNLQPICASELKEIDDFVNKRHTALPPIRSVRRGNFHVQVSPSNSELIRLMDLLGKPLIQHSFGI